MRNRDERGFTLIEVLMASVVLVLGLGIIGGIISGMVQKNFYGQNHTQAVILAQNKIEELLTAGYDSSLLEEGDYENEDNPINSTDDSSGVFYQFWKIEDVKPIDRSKYITSTVQWTDTAGEQHTVKLTAVCIDQSN